MFGSEAYAAATRCVKDHAPDWKAATAAMKTWYRGLPKDHPAQGVKHYDHIDGYDERGNLFFPGDCSWPGGGGPTYEILHPLTNKPCATPSRGWCIPSRERMHHLISDGRIHFRDDETKVPNFKRYLRDTESWTMDSVFYQDRRAATQRLTALLGETLFDYPKDETVIARFIEATTDDDDIVMDFFGGSGTTGHAVWLQNARDGKSRRFVLATLPETVAKGSVAEKAGYATISDITLERLKRSASRVKADNPGWTGDAGFRVFRLAEEKLAWRNDIRTEADPPTTRSTCRRTSGPPSSACAPRSDRRSMGDRHIA